MTEEPESEMVERVARAICGEPDPDRIGPFRCDDGRRVEPGRPAWTAWAGDARRAIEAMREPTATMSSAAENVCVGFDGDSGDHNVYLSDYQAVEIWNVMVDAALGKP